MTGRPCAIVRRPRRRSGHGDVDSTRRGGGRRLRARRPLAHGYGGRGTVRSDETLKLYSDDASASKAPGGSVSFVMTAGPYPSGPAQHRTVVLELPAGVTF